MILSRHDFGKPIASLVFDPSGSVLVVSAGHKVFSWRLPHHVATQVAPVQILKTRRSLRALHFHPAAPHILLTAEVTERRIGGDAAVPQGQAQAQRAGQGRQQAAPAGQQAPRGAPAGQPGHNAAAAVLAQELPAPIRELSSFLAAHNSMAQHPHLGLPGHAGQPSLYRLDPAIHPQHQLHTQLQQVQQMQQRSHQQRLQQQQQHHQQQQQPQGSGEQRAGHAGGQQAAAAAAWPMGLLRAAQGLLTGVTGVFTGGGGAAAHHGAAAAAHRAASGGGGPGASLAGGSSAAAPAVAAGGARGGAGAPSVNPGGAHSSLPGDDAAAAAAAGNAASDAGGELRILNAADVKRHQSLGGGIRYAIPLVAPPAVASPPPSTPTLHPQAGAAGGGAAAPAATGPAGQYLSAFDLSWGWDHTMDASEAELLRERLLALRGAPALPGAANFDTPCVVTVRLWDFRDPSRELRKELLVLPRVVLCSEMGIHFSPCGRYLACCVVRDGPSEAGLRWQAQQRAAAAAAAAAARTHAHAAAHSGRAGGGGDDDGGEGDGACASGDGGAASAAMELGSPGSPCSCRSVEMADAEMGIRGGRQQGDAAAGGEASVAWHGGRRGRGRRTARGGGPGGGGASEDEEDGGEAYGDTATQANCRRAAGAEDRMDGDREEGGDCGGMAGGAGDDAGGPASSAVCAAASAPGPQHTAAAAACSAASRPDPAVGGGPEYDSAAAAACRRLTAAAGGGEYRPAAATAAAAPGALAAAPFPGRSMGCAASAISGVAPDGSGAGVGGHFPQPQGPVVSRAAAAPAAATEVDQHHPRRGRAPLGQRPPAQPLPQAPLTRARARASPQAAAAAAAAAMQRTATAGQAAGPSKPMHRSDPGVAVSRAAGGGTPAGGAAAAAAAGSDGGAAAGTARQTPSAFASIKAHLALHRSREAAAASAAGAGGAAAAGAAAGGSGAAAAAASREPAAADAGRAATAGGAAAPTDNADDAATVAAAPPPPIGTNTCYELCVFYTGTSPVPPTSAPAAPAASASPSAASSIAFPAAPGASPSTAGAAGAGAQPSCRAAGAGAVSTSKDDVTFGSLLYARPILAAHCVTSVQLSPSGDYVLLAYGRRHISLCSLVDVSPNTDGGGDDGGGAGGGGGALVPVHSVVEIYSLPDLNLRRVLLSPDDEVNVAVFNSFPAEGIAYGTKEGRLRLLRYDRRPPQRNVIPFAPLPPCEEDPWEADQLAGLSLAPR